jgi:hypothetical protein
MRVQTDLDLAEDDMSKRRAVGIALFLIGLAASVQIWLSRRHAKAIPSNSPTQNSTAAKGSTASERHSPQSFPTNDDTETENYEAAERRYLLSIPPEKRAEAKWTLQRWGKTDLANRGRGGAR